MTERDILYEKGRYWVCGKRHAYFVMVVGVTVSVSESAYPHDEDGYSLAKARVDYLARRDEERTAHAA